MTADGDKNDNPAYMLSAFHMSLILRLSSPFSFPTNGSHELFTLMAIDPDVPSHSYSTYSQFLQWLVVNIPQEDMPRGPFNQSSSFMIFTLLFNDHHFLTIQLIYTNIILYYIIYYITNTI